MSDKMARCMTPGDISRMDDRVRITGTELLSANWGRLSRVSLDYRRRDGQWTSQTREVYDRGDGAVILPYDPARGTVLLVRQFRLPAYLTAGHQGLIEACAGLLDQDAPADCIRRETEEELGYRLDDVAELFTLYMSPGSVTERLAFFAARYTPADRLNDGGGAAGEGEDIEVIEMTLDDALAAVTRGEIVDGKTVILLQHARLAGLL